MKARYLLLLGVVAGCDPDVEDGPISPPPPPPPIVTAPPVAAQVNVPADYGLHDTFVRDGIAFLSAWNTGITILDVGGAGKDGSPGNPVLLSTTRLSNGSLASPAIHNAWWFHNAANGERRYLFVGQEGPGIVGSTSGGDIKVVDVSNLEAPVEVAFFRIPGAGTHNFWVDEVRQVLYAAYYQVGVVAIDVSGTLSGDLASREIARRRMSPMSYTWGVMLANNRLYVSDMVDGFWQLNPETLQVVAGGNNVTDRYGSDLWIRGNHAYTGTWGGSPRSGQRGNAVKIWELSPSGAPELADSIVIEGVYTISDIQVSDNGRLLVFSVEGPTDAGLYVYDLQGSATDPVKVGYVNVVQGLHTVTLSRIGTRLYAFAARNPASPALIIYDLSDYER
jgi:hypothetical protein